MKHDLTFWILPTLAALSLATALVLRLVLPQERLLAELTAQTAQLEQRAHELREVPFPSPDEAADLVPLRISLGEVVRVVEERARRTGIETITLASGGDEERPAGVTGTRGERGADAQDEEAVAQAGERGEATEAVNRAKPEILECRIVARAGFMSLVHFLGALESGAPLMRIRALEVLPAENGVEASFVLQAFAYAGPIATEASLASPGR